ncbi:MAG: sigma-70 family RNA polymerase sigma factor [Planctomycetes bacterium]|nr:sigma-70 family RNA polymerase sigma factor [Planctomycetota bacterium]
MATERTDGELVELARSGDRDAFAELAARHAPRLDRFLCTMTGDEHVAADVRQEALHSAMTRLEQLREPSAFPGWLLSIACNACRKRLRSDVQRSHDGGDALHEVPEARRSALSSLVRREDAVRLALAIDRLPIALREAFVLFVVEGMPYAEIAAATGASENTLQVRVHRGKALLRQQLGAVADTWWSKGR